jgi:hypothetical protein
MQPVNPFSLIFWTKPHRGSNVFGNVVVTEHPRLTSFRGEVLLYAVGSIILIIPVVTAVAPNAIKAIPKPGSMGGNKSCCRWRIIM